MYNFHQTGMSTTHEVIIARHMGMKVFGISLITNECVLDCDSDDKANHLEVLAVGKERALAVQKLISQLISKIEI